MQFTYDPAKAKAHAARGDPPRDEWPGQPVDEEMLYRSAGDPRDWFHPGHRLEAADQAWAEFEDSRDRRRNLFSGFDWNQILIIGEFGAGKTTLGVLLARYYFGLGHPVFSNTSCLFGWRLGLEELYTAMGRIPKNSVLLVDESSASLSGSMGAGVAVQMWGEFGLNLRKQNCVVVYMTAKDHMVAHSVRRECKEVWMPIKRSDMTIEKLPGYTSPADLAPRDDPDNFMMGVHVWDDYPYQKQNLIEGKDPNDKGGFGSPVRTRFYSGTRVREAYLLNDTFELAQAGAARLSDTESIKDDARAQLEGRDGVRRQSKAEKIFEVRVSGLLQFLESKRYDPVIKFFTPAALGGAMGISDPGTAARFLRDALQCPDLELVRRHGYRASDIFDALAKVSE